MREFHLEPVDFVLRSGEGKEGAVRLNLRKPTYLLCEAPDVLHVLAGNQKNFRKCWLAKDFLPLLGEGLFTMEAETHLQTRKQQQPAWMRPSLESLASVMLEDCKRVSSSWPEGGKVNLVNEFVRMGEATAARFVFGIGEESTQDWLHKVFIRAHFNLCRKVYTNWWRPEFLQGHRNRVFQKHKMEMDRFLLDWISKAREAPEAVAGSLLGNALGQKDAIGVPPGDEEIMGQLKSIYSVGADPVRTLAWLFFETVSSKDAHAVLLHALQDKLQGRDPAFADFRELPIVDHLFSETLRLYPHAWLVHREAVETDTLPSGTMVQRGEHVFLCPLLLHRDPRYFENPGKFNPNRFLETPKPWPKGAYFPFGLGVRNCIGEHYARLQAFMTTAYLFQHFEFEPANGSAPPRLDTPNCQTLQPEGHTFGFTIRSRASGDAT